MNFPAHFEEHFELGCQWQVFYSALFVCICVLVTRLW